MNELVNTSAPESEDLTIPEFLKREAAPGPGTGGEPIFVQSEEDLPKEALEGADAEGTGI